jgi:hypothetical protein
MKRIVFSLVVVFASFGAAVADCSYNGSTYAEGAVIGPYVCTDGQWVAR